MIEGNYDQGVKGFTNSKVLPANCLLFSTFFFRLILHWERWGKFGQLHWNPYRERFLQEVAYHTCITGALVQHVTLIYVYQRYKP